MEATTSLSRSTVKPLPYVYSYHVKEQQDAKKLCKSRFKLKNLFLNEYTIKRNKWVHRKHPLIIKRSYFSHLKVLSGLHFPLCFAKIPSFNKFSKQACWSLRNLSFNLYYNSAGMKRFEKHLIRMKHLTNFRDINSNFDQGTKILTEVKGFEHVKSLAMPCHVAPKRLDKLQKMSIDLQKLEKCGRIIKLPLSLIELSLIDNNPLDERIHGEIFWMLKDQLNSLKNLRYLNLISPKKSYYLFLDLELKNVKITIQSQVNFSEALLLQMEDYVEKTDSSIKIVPSGFSQPEDYLRLLSFLENRPRIQLERVLFPFNSTGDLQRQLIGYYRKMLKETNRVEFLFEFHSENGWFEMENIKNFKEMMKVVEKEDAHVIYHFLHNQHKELKKPREKEIIQAAIDLFKDRFEKEITMKVTGDVFGFEMLKSFLPKLFEESLLKFDKIYWEHYCLYIAGLGDILRDLTHKRAIKSYSLITYQ